MWFSVSSGTSRAPGTRPANSRPSSNGTRRSPRACRISVGYFTRDADSRTSIENMPRMMRGAHSGVADMRCNSLMELSCSRVAPGMNPMEKI
jgi:hypothetical protein